MALCKFPKSHTTAFATNKSYWATHKTANFSMALEKTELSRQSARLGVSFREALRGACEWGAIKSRSLFSVADIEQSKQLNFPMKTKLLACFVISMTSAFLLAQEQTTPSVSEATETPTTARLIAPLNDGTPPPPEPPKPAFIVLARDILESKTVQQGGRTITVRKINPIALPPRPEAPAPIDFKDPAVQQRIAAHRAKYPAMKQLAVGATIYHSDNSPPRSLVHLWPQTEGEPVTVWSSANFALLAGIPTFATSSGEKTSFMMMWSTIHLDRANNLQRNHVRHFPAPEIPIFPEGKATFQVVLGNPTPETLTSIQSLHDLYNNEHTRLLSAYQGRERARLAHEAEQKAKPPQPKDIILNYWLTDSADQATKGATR